LFCGGEDVGKAVESAKTSETDVAEKKGGRSRALKPSECKKLMRTELAKQFPEILKGFVDEAKSGSCGHLKLINQLLETPPEMARKKGVTQRMLDELSGKKSEWSRMRGPKGKFAAKP
jgi:hypothetical protein